MFIVQKSVFPHNFIPRYYVGYYASVKNIELLEHSGDTIATLLDRSPAFLTSDDFIRSNEIIRTKWPIYVVIGHLFLTI